DSIIILKGFDTSELAKENKYFSFEIDYFDTVELSNLQELVIEDIIKNRTFTNTYLWMTIEEYQLFKEQEAINKMQIILLENNLFNNKNHNKNILLKINIINQNIYNKKNNELEKNNLKYLKMYLSFMDK